jgi:hypothetical protein
MNQDSGYINEENRNMNEKAGNVDDPIKSESNSGDADKSAYHDENGHGEANKNVHSNLTLVRWLDQPSKDEPYAAIYKCISGTNKGMTMETKAAHNNSSSLEYLTLEIEAHAMNQGEDFVVHDDCSDGTHAERITLSFCGSWQ